MTDEELIEFVDAYTIMMLADPRPLAQGDAAVEEGTRAFLRYMRTQGYEDAADPLFSLSELVAQGRAPWRTGDGGASECDTISVSHGGGAPGIP